MGVEPFQVMFPRYPPAHWQRGPGALLDVVKLHTASTQDEIGMSRFHSTVPVNPGKHAQPWLGFWLVFVALQTAGTHSPALALNVKAVGQSIVVVVPVVVVFVVDVNVHVHVVVVEVVVPSLVLAE
jgi:hypothetical protein